MSEKQVKKTSPETSSEGIVYSNPGRNKCPVYKRVYDDTAKKNVVKKVDEFDVFEFIQASKSTTDLALLQKQYAALGEVPGLEVGWEEGPDQTIMPANIHEVYQMTSDIDAAFKRLPESVQKMFGSKDAYLRSLIDGSYQAILINGIKEASKVSGDTNKEVKEGNDNE